MVTIHRRPLITVLIAAVALTSCWYGVQAQDAPKTPEAQSSGLTVSQTQALERKWKFHWYKFGKHCAKVEGKFVICETYDFRYPSSLGITIKQASIFETKIVKIRTGILVRPVKIKPDNDDIKAYAKALPDMAPGHYGYIHSAKVVSKQGPFSMVVDDIRLVDEKTIKEGYEKKKKDIEDEQQAVQREYDRQRRINDQRNRQNSSSRTNSSNRNSNQNRQASLNLNGFTQALKDLDRRYKHRLEMVKQQASSAFGATLLVIGQPTKGLRPGTRWFNLPKKSDGIQLAIVGSVLIAPTQGAKSTSLRSSSRRRSGSILVAVPALRFRRGLPEEDFLAMVLEAGMTKQSFVEKVIESMQEFPGQPEVYEPILFELLAKGLNEATLAKAVGLDSQSASADAGAADTDDAKTATPTLKGLSYAERRALSRAKRRGTTTDTGEPTDGAAADGTKTADGTADAGTADDGKSANTKPAATTTKPLTYKERRELARQKRRGTTGETSGTSDDSSKTSSDTKTDTKSGTNADSSTKKPLTYKERRELSKKKRREEAKGGGSSDDK